MIPAGSRSKNSFPATKNPMVVQAAGHYGQPTTRCKMVWCMKDAIRIVEGQRIARTSARTDIPGIKRTSAREKL